MANPSTTGGSGAGTEVLRRVFKSMQLESASELTLLTVGADHIFTILNVMIMEKGDDNDLKINMYIDPDSGGAGDIYFLQSSSIPFATAFLWNDRFVMTAADKLHFTCSSASAVGAVDIWCSYIDQQF